MISSLKDSNSVKLSVTAGFSTVNLADKAIPWFIKGGTGSNPSKFLKYVTGTASGSMWAIPA